jgi:DNA-binding CsgD family transcriptional regulator
VGRVDEAEPLPTPDAFLRTSTWPSLTGTAGNSGAMKRDYVSIIEAIYAPAESEQAWVGAVAEAAAPCLDFGLGLNVYTYDARNLSDFRVVACASQGNTPMDGAAIEALVRSASPELIRMAYLPGPPMYFTQLEPELAAQGVTDIAEARARMAERGLRDVLALRGCDLSMQGCLLTTSPTASTPRNKAQTQLLACLSAHLTSGWRLQHGRGAADDASSAADAILDHSGRLLDARAEDAKAERSTLTRECRKRFRALGELRSLDQAAAVALWRAMVQGEWTLVDRFDSDGKHMVLAVRNRPGLSQFGVLTLRESQVARYASCGLSLKAICYELGLSSPSVHEHLKSALRKLRLKSRAELVAVLGPAVPRQG